MRAVVTLSVIAGPSAGLELVFDERTTCIAGRGEDCEPRIGEDDPLVSRHHCLFDVNPPDLRVRDFGSLNGTQVNGVEIGRRRPEETPEQGARREFGERDLVDGDEVLLGRDTVLRVTVVAAAPPAAAPAAAPVPASTPAPAVAQAARCTNCGKEVSSEIGRRQGALLCASCRSDPAAIVRNMLREAASGDQRLAAIRGYETVRELGRGGQGIVYLARREQTGELIALKVLLAEVAVDDTASAGFLREIRSTRALEHPNVVAFRDCDCSGATFFFASEYCDGGSVQRLMAERGGTIAVDEAVAIVSQVLDGLAYAHSAEIPDVQLEDGGLVASRGLVHRDIKPSNILLAGPASQRVAKLGDFGLAKAFDRAGLSGHTLTGAVAGTVQFMARQQVVSFKYAKPEVDVWATAATLYNMLTGALTRDFPAGVDPITVILHNDAVPIRQRDRSIPRKLAAVIDAALVDKPRIAVQSAAELKRALQSAT